MLYHYSASSTAYEDSTWRLCEAALLLTVALCPIAALVRLPIQIPLSDFFRLLGPSPQSACAVRPTLSYLKSYSFGVF